jgi:hypothetical protein
MSAEPAILTHLWKVGSRTCTMVVPCLQPGRPVHVAIEWCPTMPRRLSAEELSEYRAGRDAALAELARELGGSAVLFEV